jgi:hypothetical protein
MYCSNCSTQVDGPLYGFCRVERIRHVAAALHDQIETLTTQLEKVALTKGLAPIRRVNKAFNRPLHAEVLYEATN